MAPQPSFAPLAAPLAARLAAHAAALRPAQRGRDGVGAAVMALVWGLVIEYLIWTCERLDARAAAEAAGAMAAPAPRGAEANTVPAPRAIRQAPLDGMRAPRLALIEAATPGQADAASEAIARPIFSRVPGSFGRATLARPPPSPGGPFEKRGSFASTRARLYCYDMVTNIRWGEDVPRRPAPLSYHSTACSLFPVNEGHRA